MQFCPSGCTGNIGLLAIREFVQVNAIGDILNTSTGQIKAQPYCQ